MSDPTPAEIEAGARSVVAWSERPVDAPNPGQTTWDEQVSAAVLAAVLPDHDARGGERRPRAAAGHHRRPGRPSSRVHIPGRSECWPAGTAPTPLHPRETPMADPAYETVRKHHIDLAARINAALADLEHVRAGRATTHHDACWDEHVACLAARIRRTLTGEDAS